MIKLKEFMKLCLMILSQTNYFHTLKVIFFCYEWKRTKKFYKTIKELDFSKINIKQSDFETAKILIKNFIKNKIADLEKLKKQTKNHRDYQLNNICEKKINNLNHHIKKVIYLKNVLKTLFLKI